MPGTIVVIGSINVDYTAVVDVLPAPGETVLGGDLVVANGGKGANQAVAAARAGGAVAMVGCVGDDAVGQAYVQKLREEGIEVDRVTIAAAAKTGVALILVQRGSGENCIAVCPGANSLLSVAAVEGAGDLIAGAAMVLCQLETPLPSVLRAAQMARAAGVPFVLNPSPVPAQGVPAELLALTDYLVLNETEIERIGAGLGVADREAVPSRLVSDGITAVIQTLGADGCATVDAAGVGRVKPFAVEPVDAVGAGDAFAGALATALAEGRPLEEAALFANAAGALAVTAEGAMPSLPRRQEIGRLLADSGGRLAWT